MSEEELIGIFASAEEACEQLHQYAKAMHYSAQNGDWQGVLDTLEMARGYGFFDDHYHRKLVMQHLKGKEEGKWINN